MIGEILSEVLGAQVLANALLSIGLSFKCLPQKKLFLYCNTIGNDFRLFNHCLQKW